MEKTIIIQLSIDELRELISEVFLKVFDDKITPLLPDEKKYITRKEVAEKFHVTLPTIHAWINSGKINALKIGRRTLFDLSEVENAASPKYKRI